MKKMKDKVSKRRINWRDVLFHLHKKSLSEAYTMFRLDHPDMSINRCAYYVLKSNYSTTSLKSWRFCYERLGVEYETLFNLQKVNAYE